MLMEMGEEGDDSMMRDIAAQFIKDITGVMAQIDGAISAGNLAQVAVAAHTIKGSAATFGLHRVEKIARQMEGAAKNGATGEIPEIFTSLREAFATGRGALEDYFAKG